MTPQAAHDAFVGAGIIGPSYPTGGADIPSGAVDATQPARGRLPPNQLGQYPVGTQTHEFPSGSQLGIPQPAGGGQISNVPDQSLISSRPTGGQYGGDEGGYRYQTPQDRLPSNVGGQTGKTAIKRHFVLLIMERDLFIHFHIHIEQ